MVKSYLAIKLKDPQHYYLDNETIDCIVDLRLEKVLQDPILRVTFTGRSSSYSNGVRIHSENIFTRHREVSISKWNSTSNLKKMSEIEFVMEIPTDIKIPSYKNLEGSDGGKIEYMIEANLEALSGMFKRKSVIATHIVQVPIIGNIDVSKKDLLNPRESSIRWPKNEENANTCVLSAWIPHEGCVRGKDVPIRVELKQPDRYQAPKSITVELICQELVASSKDRLPEMTKQLADKVIQKDENAIKMMHPETGESKLLTSSPTFFVVSLPSNMTPTIRENAKVMRLDYKIRVSVQISGADSGRDKVLNVNLPIVIGTTGGSEMSDSGFEFLMNSNNQDISGGGSTNGTNSLSNGKYGKPNLYSPSDVSSISMNYGIQSPIGGGGFHIPDPHYNSYYPPNNVYPPPNRFVLNPQQLQFLDDNNGKFEGMPVPDFGNTTPYPPINIINREINNEGHNSLSSSPSNATVSSAYPDRMSQIHVYPPYANPNNNNSSELVGYPPASPSQNHSSTHPAAMAIMPVVPQLSNSTNIPFNYNNPPLSESPSQHSVIKNDDFGGFNNASGISPFTDPEDIDSKENMNSLGPSFDDLYITSTIANMLPDDENTRSSTSIHYKDRASLIRNQSLNKPNTPTPPQTPASDMNKGRPTVIPTSESTSSSYYSTMLANNDSHIELKPEQVSPPKSPKKSTALRIDPLDKLLFDESMGSTWEKK